MQIMICHAWLRKKEGRNNFEPELESELNFEGFRIDVSTNDDRLSMAALLHFQIKGKAWRIIDQSANNAASPDINLAASQSFNRISSTNEEGKSVEGNH
jgi:hypothetical protein